MSDEEFSTDNPIESTPDEAVEAAAPARPPRPAPRSGGGYGGGGYGSGGGGGYGGGSGGQRRRPTGERGTTQKVCQFCVDKVRYIDYKKGSALAQYIAGNGKIFSRRRTGTCAKHQRRLAVAVKRARFLALLPYTSAHRSANTLGGD